jgi:predicted acyltransferase
MNMLSSLKMLEFLNPVKPIFGIILGGNNPLIVLTGLIAGLIIKNFPVKEYKKIILIFAGLGIAYLLFGFFLRRWFIISKIQATPSWGMICSGISMIVFIILYWVADIRKKIRWAEFLRPAGENSLTTYLAPDILYYLIWSTGVPILYYKQSHEPLVVIAGSLFWAILMVGLTKLLSRLKIKLKI